jgi:ABC-type multidrug transport system fused ATPase/permease subunit
MVLSDGQKARVALARALYSSARILLVDDCLSSLDANTGLYRHLSLNFLYIILYVFKSFVCSTSNY